MNRRTKFSAPRNSGNVNQAVTQYIRQVAPTQALSGKDKKHLRLLGFLGVWLIVQGMLMSALGHTSMQQFQGNEALAVFICEMFFAGVIVVVGMASLFFAASRLHPRVAAISS